ncbi:MAG: tetratricopeptide repeat protein [Ferruginibacter sp.]
MLKAKFRISLTLFSVALCCGQLYAQPTWTIDPFGKEKKPEQYEEKKLASEKTADKKFTTVRHFIQNNVTHYNFYFNANNRLNAVIERAKMSQKDDYSKLLAFYPYSLENTSAQKTELDSVIYKSTAGILLHDLRSDWVDNMYLLIGKAYFYRNELDSAALTFQFINYNLFPRKKKEDDNRIVGTNDEPGTGALSIANKEKRNIIQKAITLPPSRNDALIWLARTFTQQEEYADAAGLINILQNDRNLPKRLRNDLEEVNAYWFYAQENYDSAANHLEKALTNAETKEDKSRWEFLLAQMFEMSGSFDKASDYYAKAAKHTTDPVMDIYARLNDAKMMRNNGNTKELENSIANLLRMARRDKYEAYRDIIYYSTAQLSMQRPDTTNSIGFYNRSIYYNTNNSLYKNKSFYQLATLAYAQTNYKGAKSYYDSLLVNDDLEMDAATLETRKQILGRLVQYVTVIEREDSLQRIAAMHPAERDAYIKKLVKQLRKENGLKEEDNFSGNTIITFNNKNGSSTDLFSAPSKGEWYFYNASLRTRGFNDFKSKWGKRTNTDNWRRKAATEAKNAKAGITANTDIDAIPDKLKTNDNNGSGPVAFSFDALMSALPTSPEKLDSSNALIAENMLALARVFKDELENYQQAINTYAEYLQRFPNSTSKPEVYFGLYYCYTKLGNNAKAADYKKLLINNYTGDAFTTKIMNPAAAQPDKKNPEVTSRYSRIYDMFIEGNFTEAMAEKKRADSLYGNNYWTPQLLYIEAMYLVKEKRDGEAIAALTNLQNLYPSSPLKSKAATLVEVLGRRTEIESYLNNLQVTRQEETLIIVSDEMPAVKAATIQPITAPVKKIEVAPQQRNVTDSIKAPPVFVNGAFTLEPNKQHFLIMILDKVDGVYINEAKNAFNRFNRGSMLTQNIVINRDAIDANKVILVFTPFADADAANKYFDKIKKAAPAEISWLPANKYSFLIITEANLQLLKTNKDLDTYKKLLNTNYGNKF